MCSLWGNGPEHCGQQEAGPEGVLRAKFYLTAEAAEPQSAWRLAIQHHREDFRGAAPEESSWMLASMMKEGGREA